MTFNTNLNIVSLESLEHMDNNDNTESLTLLSDYSAIKSFCIIY
jgi:hypothetical protein